MRAVREEQASAIGRFSGPTRISDEHKQAITQAIDDSALAAHVKDAAHIALPVNALAERFEELCRRRGAVMTEGLRRSVVKLLAAELWVNHAALATPAEDLITATVLHGAVTPELLEEFPQRSRRAVARAMERSPVSPWTALERSTGQKER